MLNQNFKLFPKNRSHAHGQVFSYTKPSFLAMFNDEKRAKIVH
jgi:hypothetical protein